MTGSGAPEGELILYPTDDGRSRAATFKPRLTVRDAIVHLDVRRSPGDAP